MGDWGRVLYWAAAGAAMGFGLVGILSVGLPFLLLGATAAVPGTVLLGRRGLWGLPLGFGGAPALLLTAVVLREVLRCSGGVSGGEANCAGPPGAYVVLAAVFWAVALSGPVVEYTARRHHRRGGAPGG